MKKTKLKVYSGNRALGIDPSPEHHWRKGVLTLDQDTDGFRKGDHFIPVEKDSQDPSFMNDGSGIWEFEPLRAKGREDATNATRKLGSNRGKTRLWLEGAILESHGWKPGDRFDVIWIDGVMRYAKYAEGQRKVAGKPGRPIIDTNTDKLSTTLNALPGEVVNVIVTAQSITVQK